MLTRRIVMGVLLTAACLLQSACSTGGYVLRGRVVEGDASMLCFVDRNDAQLSRRGLGGVKLVVHRDGDKPWPKRVAEGMSRADGEIAIPINEFGAGWMIEQWLVEAFKPGYETCEAILAFPSGSAHRDLLIVLAPGEARSLRPKDELMDQYEQYR